MLTEDSGKNVHFDRWQFDDVRLSIYRQSLFSRFGQEDINRMQIFKSKRHPHKKPAYLKTRKACESHLCKHLKTTPNNLRRQKFIQWLDIIYSYYILSHAARDIAEEMHISINTIKCILKRLKKL
jgi:hypothetical protein